MYFPSTPSNYGKMSAKLSPKTAATENRSSFFRSRAIMDEMRGGINNLIQESQSKKNSATAALSEVWRTNEEALEELNSTPRINTFNALDN